MRFYLLQSEVNKSKEEGIVGENIGAELYRQDKSGGLSVGRLVENDGNIYFEKSKRNKDGKTKRVLIGERSKISSKDLMDYGVSKYDADGFSIEENNNRQQTKDTRLKAKENKLPTQEEAINTILNETIVDGKSIAESKGTDKMSLEDKVKVIEDITSNNTDLTDSQKISLLETAFDYDSFLNDANQEIEFSKNEGKVDELNKKKEPIINEIKETESEIEKENKKANTTSEESLDLHIVENIDKISTTDLNDKGFTTGTRGKVTPQWSSKKGVKFK